MGLRNICDGSGYKKINDLYYQDYKTMVKFPNLTHVKENPNINYLDSDQFTYFIDKISAELSENGGCITTGCTVDYFLHINFNELKYYYTSTFLNNIKECLKTSTRVFIPINLRFANNMGHSNLIIIDQQIKKIYFFEPHGEQYSGDMSQYINIENRVIEIVQILFGLIHFTFENIFDLCPIGPQSRQSTAVNYISSGGFCLSWSLLTIHLILLNLDKPVGFIKDFLTHISAFELNCYIQKYTSFISTVNVTCERLFRTNEPLEFFSISLPSTELQIINSIIHIDIYKSFLNNQIRHKPSDLFKNMPQYTTEMLKAYDRINNGILGLIHSEYNMIKPKEVTQKKPEETVANKKRKRQEPVKKVVENDKMRTPIW